MSGASAMGMRVFRPLASALPADCRPSEAELAWRFTRALVRCAAAVIEGAKPAALFSLDVRAQGCPSAAREVMETYSRELPRHGLRLAHLGERGSRLQLLVWRPDALGCVLREPFVRDFLAQRGFFAGCPEELAQAFVRALREFHAGRRLRYPHEVGLLLGYPLEDVVGYLRGARETCRGPWRSYGDERVARQRFERIAQTERRCRERYEAGLTLGALLGET